MFYVRWFTHICKSGHKIKSNSGIMSQIQKKCVCKESQHNLYSVFSQMEHNFKFLSTPVKSPSDKKEYKVIQLENGLIACIISDTSSPTDSDEIEELSEEESCGDETCSDEASTDSESSNEEAVTEKIEQKMAAAGLCVGVGSFSDPKEVPGMAHFLEHMVFMGSQKFPGENDFDSFIKKGGGSNNAATDAENTCFYFECLEKYLGDGLDKFAQFFIKPLMKKNAMTREREAIESEFQMALPSDLSKKEQLLCSLSDPESPVNSFSWGNLLTLRDNISDDKLYEGVHKFRERHYSAHRMTLAIQARLPLDTLQNFVIECFSHIPNNKLPAENYLPFACKVFDTPEFPKMFYVKPTKDVSHLDLTWCLPPLMSEYKSNPLNYLSHLLGDEGTGSLTAYLRKMLWATGVSAGNEEGGLEFNSLYSLFSVSIILTDSGLDHIEEVIESVYSYVNMLKRIGPQERIFNEIKLISDTAFQFASEESAIDTVEQLCEAMQIYPPSDYITGSNILYEYNEEVLRSVTESLEPNKMNVMIWTKNLPGNLKFDKKEQWFGTEYTNLDIPQTWRDKWMKTPENTELHIPPPNPYVAREFSIIPECNNHPEYPQKILDDPLIEMWYRADQKFQLPQAYFRFYLISPMVYGSAKNSAMLDLTLNLLLFAFAQELYPATCANLNSSFYTQERGLVIKVNGYNDKLPVLVENIAVYLSQINDKIDKEMFAIIKDKLKKAYYNKILKPSKLAKDLRMHLLLDKFYTPVEKYESLQNMDLEQVKTFISTYLSTLHIRCLVQGNITKEIAKDTVTKFAEHLKCLPFSKEVYPRFRVIQIPQGEKCISIDGFNKDDANSIVVNYYQMGTFNLRESVIIDIIMQIIEEPVFDILRTKEQLGYHVDCSARNTFGVLGYIFTVNCQATKYTTSYVDERIEEFLVHSQKLLDETTDDELDEIKEDLIKTKEIADVHLQEEVGRNWEEIITDDYMFDRNVQEIEAIRSISVGEIKEWWKRHNRYGTREHFRKISFQVMGHDNKTDNKIEIDSDEQRPDNISLVLLNNQDNRISEKKDDYFISDIKDFKESVYLYPSIYKR